MTIKLDIVTVERSVFSDDVDIVIAPGTKATGYITSSCSFDDYFERRVN